MHNQDSIIELLDKLTDNIEILLRITRGKLDEVVAIFCNTLDTDHYSFSTKTKALSLLYYTAFREDMTLQECWEIYWIITSRLFVDSKEKIIDFSNMFKAHNNNIPIEWKEIPSRSILYRYIFNTVFAEIDYSRMTFRTKEERNAELIVIITDQFLGLQHAPTVRVLDYAYTIQEKIGKKVIIINSAGTHYLRKEEWNFNSAFSFIEDYNNVNRIEYKNTIFEFVQVSCFMPDINVLQFMTEMIYKINPLFVYNIGASCLLADLCTPFVTTASLPCSLYYPVTCSEYLLVGRSVSKSEDDYNNILDYQKVLETNYNFIYKNSSLVYKKEDFQIPFNSFVITTVGYRLEEEIDDSFINVIDKILDYERFNVKPELGFAPLYMVIVGVYNNKEKLLDRINPSNRKRIIFTGLIQDASEFTRLCNLYINPERMGGGRSSFDCLHFGIPVVTLKYGDVYYICGKEFGVENWDEYYDIVRKYCYDVDWYDKQREVALQRASKLEDIESTLRDLINNLMKMRE